MSLLKNTSKVSFFTLVSRFLGLIRDGIFARVFGAGAEFDVFLIAFKIPQFMRRVFSEGAFSQAFIPMLKEQEQQQITSRHEYLDEIFSLLLLASLVVTVSAWWFPDMWILFFAAGIRNDPRRYAQALDMVRWIFPSVMMISLGGFFSAALQSKGAFSAPALTPAIQNVVFILSACVACWLSSPIDALIWGLLMASFLQIAWLWLQYRRLYPSIAFVVSWTQSVKRTVMLMATAMFATSVNQLSVMVDSVLLSYLPQGGFSWFYYAERLSNLPLGLFSVAISTVLSPALAESFHKGQSAAYRRQLDWGVLTTCLLCVPSAFGLYVFAEPVLAMFFLGGKFQMEDVIKTSKVLKIMALGVPAFTLQKILVCAYASKKQMQWPTRCAMISLAINIALSVCLMASLGYLSVAVAMCASAYVNVSLLWWRLCNECEEASVGQRVHMLSRVVVAGVPLLGLAWALPTLQVWVMYTWYYQLLYMVLAATGSLGLYAASLKVLGVPLYKVREGASASSSVTFQSA